MKTQKTPQKIFSQNEDFYNEFLIRATQGKVTRQEMQMTRVDARLNAVSLRQMDERAVVIGLTKIITDVFEYFSAQYSETVIDILINDIINDFGVYSVLEIYKGIHEGRRSQGDLFGKLSGLHFRKWLNDYFAKMGDELSEYRRNEKIDFDKRLDELQIENPRPAKPKLTDDEKKEHSAKQKAEAMSYFLNLSDEQKARNEHSRNWNISKGDYKTWMTEFDQQNSKS